MGRIIKFSLGVLVFPLFCVMTATIQALIFLEDFLEGKDEQ